MRKILVVCTAIILSIFLLSCTPAQFFPKEGIWYCSELEMQLDFQDETSCFLIYEREKVICALGYERGSSWLSVGCQDPNTTHFMLGEEVFGAEFVSLESDRLVLLEAKTGTEYCFLKVQ